LPIIVPAMSGDHDIMNSDEWGALAAAAQGGDKRAYNQLLMEISVFSKSYVVKGLANADWAEDIAQEVLLSVHKALKTYSPDRPFRPWLISIIHFRRTDFLRKHYSKRDDKKVSIENIIFSSEHVTKPDFAGEYKDIEAALDGLPEKQRKVFQMIKIQGYSAQEVADEMGMSVSAVKVSAHRSLSKIRSKLA